MEQQRAVWTILFLCVLVYFGFMLYNLASIDAYNPMVVFGGLMILAAVTAQNIWGDWFTFLKAPPEFVTISGVGGRLLSGPEPLPGGKMKCRVSINRATLARHLKQSEEGGFFVFLGMFSGTTVREVVGYREQFVMVDPNDCENPNGCMHYLGRLDGAELRNQNIMSGLTELRRVTDLYRATVTTMKLYGQQLSTLINQRLLDDEYTYERAKMIADNMKNVKIISKGAGGGAAEAVAAELM